MKTLSLFLLTAAVVFGLQTGLRSQTAARDPQKTLETMKAKNKTLLEQQEATIKGLDSLYDITRQVRIMSKRT